MWPFKKKKSKTRETAIKRMNSFLTTSNRKNGSSSQLRFENVSEDELDYVIDYIKDYAVHHLSVKKENVKVHVSKEGNSITIVANIIYQ
jgi:septum formation topological specificity factor MinE